MPRREIEDSGEVERKPHRDALKGILFDRFTIFEIFYIQI